MYNTNQKVDGR